MEEYPSNSNRQRRQEERPPEKKVERVVQGEVIRRKKSFTRRLTEHFVGANARGAWSHIALEVLLPMIKDGFVETFHEGIDHVFDNDRRYSRRGRSRPGSGSYVSYNRYSQSSHRNERDRDRDEPRRISRRGRANHNFEEIILPTRVEAEEVIERLFDLIDKFEVATVADLYDMVGVTDEYTDRKWGWEDMQGARATRVRGGYLLDLPRPEPIE